MKRNVKRHAVIQPLNTSYRVIPLTRLLNALVDADMFEYLSQWNWHSHGQEIQLYAARVEMPVRILYLMHREVITVPDGMVCDHINGNTLDNRRCNLRAVTQMQNVWNSQRDRDSQQPYKGVFRRKDTDKWRACITINKVRFRLGQYDTAEEAKAVYDAKAIEHFGEYYRRD